MFSEGLEREHWQERVKQVELKKIIEFCLEKQVITMGDTSSIARKKKEKNKTFCKVKTNFAFVEHVGSKLQENFMEIRKHY